MRARVVLPRRVLGVPTTRGDRDQRAAVEEREQWHRARTTRASARRRQQEDVTMEAGAGRGGDGSAARAKEPPVDVHENVDEECLAVNGMHVADGAVHAWASAIVPPTTKKPVAVPISTAATAVRNH